MVTSNTVENVTFGSMSNNNYNITNDVENDNDDATMNKRLESILFFVFVYGLQIPVLFLGICTNLINIIVFTFTGQRDSVSISFMALSVSDLGYCFVLLVVRLTGMLGRLGIPSRIRLNVMGLSHYLSHYAAMCQDISVAITVFLAVQKCCCVAIPHLFRNVFTPTRTVVIILCSSLLVSIAWYIPLIVSTSFATITFPPSSNLTIISMTHTPLYPKALRYWRGFNKITLPFVSQFVSLFCLIVMVVQLRKSAQFRSVADGEKERTSSSTSQNRKSTTRLGYKERRVLTAVALVLAMFVVSTMPIMVSNVVVLIFGSSSGHLLDTTINILMNLSSAMNIFVYVRYNTKFKETTNNLFRRGFRIQN